MELVPLSPVEALVEGAGTSPPVLEFWLASSEIVGSDPLITSVKLCSDTITLLASFTATASLPSKDSALTAEKDNAANNIKVNKNILLKESNI